MLDEPKLSEWAAAHLTRRGIDLKLKDSVNEVGPEHCVLRSGATLATRTVIWTICWRRSGSASTDATASSASALLRM